jgi:energy-converting hydrogenase Eha subunit F
MIKWIKRIWDCMDEQDKILTVYMLLLALLVLVSTI